MTQFKFIFQMILKPWLFLFVVWLHLYSISFAQQHISTVVSNGGGSSQNGNYQHFSVVGGEPSASFITGGSFTGSIGFLGNESIDSPTENFNLTILTDGFGTTQPQSGIYQLPENFEIVLSATPLDGYLFTNWTDQNNEIVSSLAEFTFTMPAQNVTLTAHFEEEEIIIPTYQLTTIVNPPNAGFAGGSGEYEAGEWVLLTAVANDDFSFDHWSDAQGNLLSESAAFHFNMPSEDTEITANFTENTSPGFYTLHLNTLPNNNAGGGASGAGVFLPGTQVTISAHPNFGFTFDRWIDESQNTLSSEQEFSFTLNSNRVITAVFEGQSFNITTLSDTENAIITGGGTYYLNQIVAVNAQAPENYQFLRWMKGDQQMSVLSHYLFSATEDRTLTAEFIPDFSNQKAENYLITATAQPEHIGVVLNQGFYSEGETVSLIASPNVGLDFVKWTENGVDIEDDEGNLVGLEYEFEVNGNRNLVAIFGGNTFELNLSANPSEGGTLNGSGAYYPGDFANIQAIENPDFVFQSWMLNGQQMSVNNQFGFTVNEDLNFIADFLEVESEAESYSLSLNVNPENAGIVSGSGSYQAQEEITITATANEGFIFVNWTDQDGAVVSSSANTTFVMPENNVTLTANFSEDGATLVNDIPMNIQIYPNPTQGFVNVKASSDIRQIKIHDLSGRLVLTSQNIYQNAYTVNASMLENGFYLLHIKFQDQSKIKIRKLQIMR